MRIDHLRSNSTSMQLRGILEATVHGNVTEAEKRALEHLAESPKVIGGRRVSDYATAAQSILGVKQYAGNDPNILELIREMPKFTFN